MSANYRIPHLKMRLLPHNPLSAPVTHQGLHQSIGEGVGGHVEAVAAQALQSIGALSAKYVDAAPRRIGASIPNPFLSTRVVIEEIHGTIAKVKHLGDWHDYPVSRHGLTQPSPIVAVDC